ncbi:MAG: Holliday junction branch migration protein RuvA [Patescibacteria group bacterium]
MIGYLTGKTILSRPGWLILEVGGVGYRIKTKPGLGVEEGRTVSFYIHHYLRENIEDLYGFDSPVELELFEKLLSVNGVGPKAAIAIMTLGDAKRITAAIAGNSLDFFLAAPGIGKKAAAKIILDLKSKISLGDDADVLNQMDAGGEVVEALAALGYKKAEVTKLLGRIPAEINNAEEKIRWCLKNMKTEA